jgi:hypothetical protein
MIIDMRESYSIIEETDRIFENVGREPVEVIMGKIFVMLAEKMEEQLMDIQKINFDLGVLTINEPERAAKIMANIKGTGNLEYLGKHAIKRASWQLFIMCNDYCI